MDRAKKVKKAFVFLVIEHSDRARLLEIFPPKYPEWIGHHITYATRIPVTAPLPRPKSIKVVGYAEDETGLECLIVEVDGTIQRPDGNVFHITWSLDRNSGWRPVLSNKVIAEKGYRKLEKPINISATARFS